VSYVGRPEIFLFFLTFLRIPKEFMYSRMVNKLKIAAPFLPIPHANWNFRHCDVKRDLADWAGYHPPLELLDQGVGSLGT